MNKQLNCNIIEWVYSPQNTIHTQTDLQCKLPVFRDSSPLVKDYKIVFIDVQYLMGTYIIATF